MRTTPLAGSRSVIHNGDALAVLRTMRDRTVRCCVTSPPYWGLRDYGTARWEGGDPACKHLAPARGGIAPATSGKQLTSAGTLFYQHASTCPCGARRVDSQLGLEPDPGAYVAAMVAVFREVRRVLTDDGTLWLNLGDSYATGAGKVGDRPGGGAQGDRWAGRPQVPDAKAPRANLPLGPNTQPNRMPQEGLKPKDLVGIPWRVAFALVADGWYLRSDTIEEVSLVCPCGCGWELEERVYRHAPDREIVWAKPNPMPESIRDRPTRSHEYVFLLSKSERYFYNAEAIAEPVAAGTVIRTTQATLNLQKGSTRQPGKAAPMKAQPGRFKHDSAVRIHVANQANANRVWSDPAALARMTKRNARSVWKITTRPFKGAHFAVFPPELPRRCILAGSQPGDVVLDPFAGSGTTIIEAAKLKRTGVGIELSPRYVTLAEDRAKGKPLWLGTKTKGRRPQAPRRAGA